MKKKAFGKEPDCLLTLKFQKFFRWFCLLLNQGLIDEISLLISPELVGQQAEYLFREVSKNIKSEKAKCTILDEDYIWLVYKAKKSFEKDLG